MSDDVTITFSADISDLQRGMQQASVAIDATTSALRSGASQLGGTFSSLSQAYAQSAVQAAQTSRDASETQLAIAREQANAQYRLALDGVKMQEALVKEQTQTSQISDQQQLQSLLALEAQREAIERQHLQAVQATYAQDSDAYLHLQQRLEEIESDGALRREQIERNYNREIYADYRRTFDQIGSSVSASIMGMIEGHETLRQAAQKVLLAIIQDFIQARIRTVADWLAGVATETTAMQVGQSAQTAAVTSGVMARTSTEQAGASAGVAANAASMIQQILASARETFAGVFGFLAPVLGPAAAGPAAAAEGAVAAAASFAVGSWELPSDMLANVHRGEMIVPASATPWAQGVLANAANGGAGGVTVNHATHFNVSALDSQDVKRWFKNNSKLMLRTINEAVRNGSHLGFDKLRNPV
jgi:hypothetical protein